MDRSSPKPCLRIVLLWGLLVGSAWGQTAQLTVDVGFEGKLRLRRWTPLYITAWDPALAGGARNVQIELNAPEDGGHNLRITQGITIGSVPATYPIYVPLSHQLRDGSVVLRDLDTGRQLVHLAFSDDRTPDLMRLWQRIDHASPGLVGISGHGSAMRILGRQFEEAGVGLAHIAPNRLPATPIGYDSLDLLVLDHPDLDRIGDEQQRAIADWVRAGGNLLLIPAAGPLPPRSPIVAALPCAVGEPRVVAIDSAELRRRNLPERFAELAGRSLGAGARAGRSVSMLTTPGTEARLRRAGLGYVAVLGVDVSPLQFGSPSQAHEFWRPLLEAMVMKVPLPDPEKRPSYGFDDSGQVQADMELMNRLGEIPGVGQFGFKYVAVMLLGMMLLVGPVDWLVLKLLRRQPWTWITTSGWIAAVTLGAVFIGHWFRSGDLHFRTLRLVDQADGATVAAAELVAIYSPQTRQYGFSAEAGQWWAPPMTWGGGGFRVDFPCAQDYQGNRPRPQVIPVWNLRFMKGQSVGSGPAVIDADLAVEGGRLRGTITNRSATALKPVTVWNGKGVLKVAEVLAPGATVQVDGSPRGGARTPSEMALKLVARRAERIEQLLAADPSLLWVCGGAESPAPAMQLADARDRQKARTEHSLVIGALVQARLQ